MDEVFSLENLDLGNTQQDNIIPNNEQPKNTISMQDALKQQEMHLDLVEVMNQKRESGIVEDIGAGLNRFYYGITDIPDNLKNATIRLFNGHIFPNMSEEQATMLMESVTREQMTRDRYRQNVETISGTADSITANLTSGIAQAVFYGLTGNLLGGVGMGISAGLQAGGETSSQYAQQYLEKTGSMKGYDGAKDFIYSSLNGAINGYIEQALGVENLFMGTIDKFTKGVGKQITKSMIEEGSEEYLQELASYTIGKIADIGDDYREDRTFFDAQRDALTNAIYGAIIGGAVGGSLYGVNRGRISKAIQEQYKVNEAESLKIADEILDEGVSKTLEQVDTNMQLSNAFGESYEQLKTKIKDSIQATGTQLFGENLDNYVELVSRDIGLQVIRNANNFGIPTKEYLDLANIQNYDNVISLERTDLNDIDSVNDLIKEKRDRVKELNIKQKTGIDTKAERSVLSRQIAQLQTIKNKLKPMTQEQKYQNPKVAEIVGNKSVEITPQVQVLNNIEINPELYDDVRQAITQKYNKDNFATRINSPYNNNTLRTNAFAYVMTYGNPTQVREFFNNYNTKVEFNDGKFTDRDLLLQAIDESDIGTAEDKKSVHLSEIESVDNTIEKQKLEDKQLFQEKYTQPTINIDGVEKSAVNSEGNPLGKTEQEIRNFYKWFGDSKVVDEQGRPLVVYHATKVVFDTFDKSKAKKGKGFWFSNNKEYASEHGGIVMNAYLKIENDFDIDIYDFEKYTDNPENTINDKETQDKITKDGFDSVAFDNKHGRTFIVFEPNQIKSVENVGTYSSDADNIYQQENLLPQNVNGFMDTELKTIVLGSDVNQGTLPHEFAHFFLQKNFELWKTRNNPDFDVLAQQLGITKEQDSLTRDQQEQFAYMTESYIFGKGLSSDMSPVVKEYLNWIPKEYESVINMGYRRADGTEYNPIINDEMKKYFDTAYASLGLSVSPTVQVFSNLPDEKGELIASDKNTRIERNNLINADKTTDVVEKTTQDIVNETKALNKYGNTEDDWVSSIVPSQGTNTREQQQELANSWVAENKELAEEIAFGSHMETEHNFVRNTSPVDRAFVIREVMKSYTPDSVEYNLLKHKLATYLSLSGKALGLNNDLSFRMYLDNYAKLNKALEQKASFIRYGKSNKAVQLFNKDIDNFIGAWMNTILNTKINSKEREIAVKNFIESAKQEFETDKQLFQENILEQLRKATRSNYEALARNYIKKMAGMLPTNQNIADLMSLSNKAQALSKNIDSDNVDEAITAGKAIKELQDYIRDKGVPESFMQKVIGGYMPRAMLSSPSTHFTNAISNTIQGLVIKGTNEFYYGKNVVSTQVINAEKNRLKKLYQATGFNLAQQYTINDKALIKGERYETTPNDEVKGIKKIDPMKFLGDSDFFFRNDLYLNTLSHIASRNAGYDVKKANELFKMYKQLATTDETSLKARQEALLVANIGVFTQNGKMAALLSQVRNTLDMANIDISKKGIAFGVKGDKGLGTLLAPFIKTPANIIELGARAIASPFTSIYTLAKGEKLSISQAIDLGELTSATIMFGCLALVGAKYQGTDDPYDRKADTIQIGSFAIKMDNFGVMGQPLRQIFSLFKSTNIKNNDWLNTGISSLPLVSELDKMKQMRDDIGGFANSFTAEQIGKLVPSLVKPITKKAINIRPDDKRLRKYTQAIGLTQSRTAIDDWTEAVSKVFLGNKIQFR